MLTSGAGSSRIPFRPHCRWLDFQKGLVGGNLPGGYVRHSKYQHHRCDCHCHQETRGVRLLPCSALHIAESKYVCILLFKTTIVCILTLIGLSAIILKFEVVSSSKIIVSV